MPSPVQGERRLRQAAWAGAVRHVVRGDVPDAVPSRSAIAEARRIVGWYIDYAYGKVEGPRRIPYFADRERVGPFAVDLDALRARDNGALFRLLILMGLYQSRRDVDIMTLQRTMPVSAARALVAPSRLKVLVERSRCERLRSAGDFDVGCDVHRDFDRGIASCGHRPRTKCHVKDATLAIHRMGDMGMLPTSAWLHLGPGGLRRWFDEACAATPSPTERARLLVARLATIHRIGPKLAAMYVSALSAPELTPGFAPWRPEIDGSRIVVVDTNVGRVIDYLRRGRGPRTYERMATWLIAVADEIDLRRFRRDLPARSPRLVQQAFYVFRSRSNRVDRQDPCAKRSCPGCPSKTCPFTARAA